MLTLQNILDSDTISTLVAKLNANFQSIALSNGGPQGVRGEQGIPGLPGRQGATGPSGPVGATGPAAGIIPFSANSGSTSVGGIPQPDASLDFLIANTVTGPNAWSPAEPFDNQVWFDNNQLGWWKYLTIPDPATDNTLVGSYIATGPYSTGPGGGFTGPGWYFYPMDFSSITNSLTSPWIKDNSNYLGEVNAAYGSPSTGPDILTQDPYGIPNARMTSKFGSVWISSFDKEDSLKPGPGATGPGSNDTSLIYSVEYELMPRLSSGVDRLLFKMSIDGVLYFDNMKARGWLNTDSGPIIGSPYQVDGGAITIPTTGPSALAAGQNYDYFVQPLYNLTIDAYAPLLYLTNRNDLIGDDQSGGTNASLGYFQYSPSEGGTVQIHNFTTRYAEEFFNFTTGPITSAPNYGEVLFDSRRFITTNQFLNMFPQDTENYTSLVPGTGPKSPYTVGFVGSIDNIKEFGSTSEFQVFQGYHSLFTGQKIAAAGNNTNQIVINDVYDWVYDNRQSWYGSSIFVEEPDLLSGGNTELIRSAGVMVRGRNSTYDSEYTGYVDGILFYTSNMTATGPNSYTATPAAERLLSLPVAYMSPARNFGVGTVTMDKVGVFEPTARFHSHADWRPELEGFNTATNYTSSLSVGPWDGIDKSWLAYTDYAPLRRMKSAAFTIERASPGLIYSTSATGPFWPSSLYATGPDYFNDWNDRGVFNDIQIGAVDTPYYEIGDLGVKVTGLPTAGLRYESFNNINTSGTTNIDHARPSLASGFGWRGALRLGTSPRYTPPGGSANYADGTEIGDNANYQAVDYQLTIAPLSVSNATFLNQAISGIGIHNLYPRARFHMYGKNTYQEFRFDEAASPGFVQPALDPGLDVTVTSWPALPSNRQIAIDQIVDSYVYNAAMYDYSYDFPITVTGYNGPTGVYGIEFSPNARNYPTKEIAVSNPFDSYTYNTSNPQHNQSELGYPRSGGGPTYAAVHGGLWNAYWDVDKYIGFNLFRDLLLKGDEKGEIETSSSYINIGATSYLNDKYASVWRTGTQGVGKDPSGPADNGGSAIFSDNDGRMGFAFLPKWRDGGPNYGQWEQQSIGTREVVNNIKIVFDSYGNIGVGNAAGIDENAYNSLGNDPVTGKNYWIPTAFNTTGPVALNATTGPFTYTQRTGPGAFPGSGGWSQYNSFPKLGRYGLGSNEIYGSGVSTPNVNARATYPEYIRFELGAEKAQGRPGHTPDKRGYGYPGWYLDGNGIPFGTGGTISITDDSDNTFANRYLGVAIGTTGWGNAIHYIVTDNIGRVINYTVTGLTDSEANGTDYIAEGIASFPAVLHPREFESGGPFDPNSWPNTTDYPWLVNLDCTIEINGDVVPNNKNVWVPVSAVACELSKLTRYQPGPEAYGAAATFANDPLQPANFRMNNFVLGDGYELVRQGGDSFDKTLVTDISYLTTRQVYEGRTASPKIMMTFGAPDIDSMVRISMNEANRNTLINAGTAPLMKVTTIIDSAQTEASLRTYTIPKADNTGGTFLVITDHMGVKGTVEPGMQPLPDTAHQADPNVSSKFRIERISAYEVLRTAPSVAQVPDTNLFGFDPANPPENFSYEMSLINYWDNGFEPHLRGVSELYYPSSGASGQNFAVETDRDTDSYWKINVDNYASRWNDQSGNNVTSTKSEVRYRRLNSDFLLFDFNISIDALDYMQLNENPLNIPVEYIIGSDGVPAPSPVLQNYVHSPWAAGYFSEALYGTNLEAAGPTWIGIDARWIQYVRIAYDIGENVTFGNDPTLQDDPNYYEYAYGGGANFGNWNDYRPWYSGTAVVGPDYTTNDENWVDNEGFLQGWLPGTDGSPYLRNTPNDQRVSSSEVKHFSKAWNGDFPDWYYGTWNQGMFHGSESPQTSPNPFFDRADLFWSNPWYKIKDTSPLRTAANAYDGWFKRSNLAAMGYSKLYRGWYQSLASPAGAGATGFVNATYPSGWSDPYLVVNIPQYFDAAVWRSFGQDAWKRNAGFQWRVTPYYNDPSDPSTPPPNGVFNTFVIEIMFDKPIHVSGANRRFSGNTEGNTDRTNELNAINGSSYLQKWSQNSSISTGVTSLEIKIPAANIDDDSDKVYEKSLEQFEFYLGSGSIDPHEVGDTMRPYGTIELRGQAMLNYKKLCAPA